MRHAILHLLALVIVLGGAVRSSAAAPPADDGREFETIGGFDELGAKDRPAAPAPAAPKTHHGAQLVPIALGFSLVAGLFVRSRRLRPLRAVFLLASLVFFGFVMGGCPCPIMILQNTMLAFLGVEVEMRHLLWFAALLALTYPLGRVYCGWLCHLGALQELLFRSPHFGFMRAARASRVMRVIQVTAFAALVIQLVLTRDIQFARIDPFKVAFNLRSATVTGWILLGLLLVSSLFVYRPFCRAFCPVGLVLGWVARLPRALRLRSGAACRTCTSCSKSCAAQAIDTRTGAVQIKPNDCFACGACLDACPRQGLYFRQKVSTHA